jgi:hypothetical protein
MKIPLWMLCGLLVSILIMDITSVWMVRGKMIQAAEMALDAALVGGLLPSEAQRGQSYIDEPLAYELALSYFRKNMALDSKLENERLTDIVFRLSFEQDGVRPKAAVEINATIKAMAPKVIGLEGIPVTIRKNQYHLSKYR